MQTIYEIKLKPLSSWITDLTSDTIFGHLCWQIKYEFGSEKLEKFLEEMNKNPIFTLSDVLPFDRVPKPSFDLDVYMGDYDEDDFETNKIFKTFEFIYQKTFKEKYLGLGMINNDEMSMIKKHIEDKEKKYNGFNSSVENKNIIDRGTFSTGDNGIYSQSVKNIGNKYDELRIFIKIFDIDLFNEYKIEELICNIFEISGYGKKKTTGKGVFQILNINKNFGIDFYGDKTDFKNILLLSNFIPSLNDSTNGNYKIFTKFPKMGESNSFEGMNFYKKPLIMIDSGSTFENDGKGYVGKMVENVDFQKKGIYHYAYGFTLEF